VDVRGQYLVERYSISYLTSGRDLLRLQVARESKDGPLVVAAPDYGRRSQVVAARLKKEQENASEEEVKEGSARSAIKELYFPPLPYAAQEGEALGALLPAATLLTKDRATKATLSQTHSPRLLHIALLQQGEGRGEALRQVQLEMLKRVNRRHPYYWASFIQSGEWANLEGKR
jgi:CHAT domain-containing protein